MLCRWKERGGVGQTRQQQVRPGFAGAKFGLNLWQGCRPSPATLPGRRCTVTPARWLSLGIRGSWLYPGVGAPGVRMEGPSPPPRAVRRDGTAGTHGRRLSGTGSQRGHFILPGKASLCGCKCPKGTARAWAVSQHTPVGRDEGVCPYGRGCIREGREGTCRRCLLR